MNRLFWGVASASFGVLISCAPPRAQAAAPAAPVAPTASAAVAPATPPAAQAVRPAASAAGSSKDVYGYLGKRGILGTMSADGSRWTGSFHFVDDGKELTLEGTATPPEPDPDAPPEEPPALDGRKVHSYLTCRFAVSGASAAIDDASCLDEDGALEIDGTWSAGKTSEAFYLRSLGAGTLADEEYYAALFATPTAPHACPPFVEMLSLSERHGRATISYRMRWPCEHQSDQERYQGVNAPSFEAYVGDFTESAPHQRLWSSQWASLADPDDPNEVSLSFDVLELGPGLELYAASMSDDFQSPTSSGGNSTLQGTVWAVGSNGRYGPKLDLPASESGHGGWCISTTKSTETWLLDLDGDKLSEIVIRITETGRHDAMGKNGPECVDSPTEVKFVAYRLNPRTLTWTQAPTPRGLTDKRLERATSVPL